MATKRVVNWALLRQCQELFEKKPSKSYMDDFAKLKGRYEYAFEAGEEVPMCKTHLCIAGSALLLSGKYTLQARGYSSCVAIMNTQGQEVEDLWKAAKKTLGVNQSQALRLFNESRWPVQFKSADNADGSRNLAANMVKRIKHFIKTKGRE